MTYLITAIQNPDPAAMLSTATSSLQHPFDLVELRLDSLPPSVLDDFSPDLPEGKWIATFRDTREGGIHKADDKMRIRILQNMHNAGAAYIDIELATWNRLNLSEKLDIPREKIILSSHDFETRPDNLDDILNQMLAVPGITPKIAWKPNDIRDNFIAFNLASRATRPMIAICMGEAGLPSRILAPCVNMFGTYCSPTAENATAPGQVTRSDMIELYNWPTINTDTKVYGVIGKPVAHSMSPFIHNGLFRQNYINGVYLPLLVKSSKECLSDFLESCRSTPGFTPGGFSVTVPHKPATLTWLGNNVTEHARRIGAVNTISNTENGLFGTNTDYHGAIRALSEGLGCEPSFLDEIPVDILGAGGVARAIVAALCDANCKVTIYNRSPERAEELASEFGMNCESAEWGRRYDSTGRILINCTPIGMWPETDDTPYPFGSINEYAAVFDTVYNPVQTRLLLDASAAGCKTINGVAMFIHQAAAQFETWTNQSPDILWMTETVLERLNARA